MSGRVFLPPDRPWPHGLLRRSERYGFIELDLVRPPTRFWADVASPPALEARQQDEHRVQVALSPAELLRRLPQDDTWTAMTRRSLARLRSWFLVAEDPQRRLDVQPVSTLSHQASLVQYVLQEPKLQRVLIADEVGLGKTVEAGLILKELLRRNPGLRVLYLAPARLTANVRRELDRLDLGFRLWVAGDANDSSLRDPRLIASIQRACHNAHFDAFTNVPPWDVIVVDEAHHLSDWSAGGGKPVRKYKLVEQLAKQLRSDGRLILMTGTPHQGHAARFQNLLSLLRHKGESDSALAGRVIYRTKEDVRDWDGQPLFPGRQVNEPITIDLGDAHREWLSEIHAFYEPQVNRRGTPPGRRAAGWRCGQALQWATSSVQAGLGYLIRQALRAGWDTSRSSLRSALEAIRPYRGGRADEPVAQLFERIRREVQRQQDIGDVEDIEDEEEGGEEGGWRPDPKQLASLLEKGIELLEEQSDAKWEPIRERIIAHAGDEKIVFFAQPIETVSALAAYLERLSGRRPAMIIGNQDDREREREIEEFRRPDGPQFLVSSRAGGEGLNLQVARRLVHVDVPWNPMELEQRVGRVHRFMSRRTIIVDTVVVKDSREVDCFEVARAKLHEIASTLVPADRFESLFARVMALVPPEELQDVLGQRPLAPFNDDERRRVADLVRRGFDQWRAFDHSFAGRQREIRSLDPGQASWEDLAGFARVHLDARPADGFKSLRFMFQDGEVIDTSIPATVLEIGGSAYACGDFGGMPVYRDDGTRAERIGLNVDVITRQLREHAFPGMPTGAAHVRWSESHPWPGDAINAPVGVLVLSRQSLRLEESAYVEHATSLHAWIVAEGAEPRPIEGKELGALIRGLLASTIRREPEQADSLLEAMSAAEARLMAGLARPTETERDRRIDHVVMPVFASVVAL